MPSLVIIRYHEDFWSNEKISLTVLPASITTRAGKLKKSRMNKSHIFAGKREII